MERPIEAFRPWLSGRYLSLQFSVDADEAQRIVWTFSSYKSLNLPPRAQSMMQCFVKLDGTTSVVGGPTGADQILWVEGMTEEKCYPRIVEHILKRPLMGTVIKAVIATGDFEGKHARRFFEIYNRLSSAQNLIPPAVGWLFDDEARTTAEKDELNKLGNGKVRFTRCRMFENNLLDARAIAAVLSTTDGHMRTVTDTEVQNSIDQLLDEPKYFEPAEPNRGVLWIRADKALERVFRDVANLEFRKTVHSVELTSWLIDHTPDKLRDVADDIRIALGWESVSGLTMEEANAEP